MARGMFMNQSHWGLHIFVETQSGEIEEEIARKTAWHCGPEAVVACLHLAHFTLVGRHRVLQRVSLETGQSPTIFRKRRFLGLGLCASACVCVCLCFLCQMNKGLRGLGILDQTLLTSWLLWAKPVATLCLSCCHKGKTKINPFLYSL